MDVDPTSDTATHVVAGENTNCYPLVKRRELRYGRKQCIVTWQKPRTSDVDRNYLCKGDGLAGAAVWLCYFCAYQERAKYIAAAPWGSIVTNTNRTLRPTGLSTGPVDKNSWSVRHTCILNNRTFQEVDIWL